MVNTMRNYLLYFCSILILCSGACNNQRKVVDISFPKQTPQIEIPVEMRLNKSAKSGEVWQGIIGDSIKRGLVLQSAPSLFFSNGMDIKRTFCTILPKGNRNNKINLEISGKRESVFSFVEMEGGKLKLVEGDKPVLVYNFGMQLLPEVPEDRRRSSYIHPVYDLQGNAVTDDFPDDHLHHRGISWMWPRVTIAGEKCDLWKIEGIRQYFERWLVQEVGPVCATLGVKNVWRLDYRKVVEEWVLVRVFSASENGRTIDVCLTWQALEPVQLLGAVKKGYGGLCFRLAPRQETIITTPDGIQQKDSNLLPFAWADESGKFGGSSKLSGVAIFQHEDNPDFPAGWCLRHYGFLGVNWPGLEPVTLEPNNPVTLRFRIWVHEGDAHTGQVLDNFMVFSRPPILQFIE